MNWIYIALAAYLINAIAFVFDKYLLHAPIPRPFAYSFWVAILSGAVIVLIPFGVHLPGPYFLSVALASGATFFIGLTFLYRAIRASEITAASTKVGAATAVFSFIFSHFHLKDVVFNQAHIIALVLMVFGMFVLSRMNWKILGLTTLSGLFSGLSFTLLKWSFANSDLVSGIFWTRLGFVAAALLSLLIVGARREVKQSFKATPNKSKYLFLLNKIVAAVGFGLLYLAIFRGDAALINGMAGLQYVFVFFVALLFKDIIPGIKENLDQRSIIIRIAGLLFIVDGFLILFLKL